MGVMNFLLSIIGARKERPEQSPGEAIMVQVDGIGGTSDVELFQAPGVAGWPVKGVRGLAVQYGGSSRNRAVVAVQNYSALAGLGEGESMLYATDQAGAVSGAVFVRADGVIELNGNGKFLVTHQELQAALTALCGTIAAHVHASNGTPSASLIGLSCDITTAKTTKIKAGP